MKVLRRKLLKKIFSMALLSIMLLKLCAYSISHFSSCNDTFAVEKNVEEGKDTKESLDKNEKKLLTYLFASSDHGHLLWINYLPISVCSHKMQIGTHPIKTVPTPPPDRLA